MMSSEKSNGSGIRAAASAMAARQLNFTVHRVGLGSDGLGKFGLGKEPRSRCLQSLLEIQEPQGLRPFLNSMKSVERQTLFHDCLVVVVSGMQAVGFASGQSITEEPRNTEIDKERLLTCFYSFGVFRECVESINLCAVGQRAARIVGGCWADIMWLRAVLLEKGDVDEDILNAQSPVTGQKLKRAEGSENSST